VSRFEASPATHAPKRPRSSLPPRETSCLGYRHRSPCFRRRRICSTRGGRPKKQRERILSYSVTSGGTVSTKVIPKSPRYSPDGSDVLSDSLSIGVLQRTTGVDSSVRLLRGSSRFRQESKEWPQSGRVGLAGSKGHEHVGGSGRVGSVQFRGLSPSDERHSVYTLLHADRCLEVDRSSRVDRLRKSALFLIAMHDQARESVKG